MDAQRRKELKAAHKAQGTWEQFERLVMQKMAEYIPEDDAWGLASLEMPVVDSKDEFGDDLAEASIFEGKKVADVESVRWAIEHYAIKNVKATDAPSKMAWSLYIMVREEPKSFLPHLSKLVTPKQDEEDGIPADDGRNVFNCIDRFMHANK